MKVDFRLTLMHSIRSVWRKNKIEGSTDIYPLTLLCMWIAAYNWWNEKHEYAVSENLESEEYLKKRDHAYKQILKLKNCINICLTEALIKPSKPIEFLHCNHEAKELLEEAQKQADELIAEAEKAKECFYEILDENGDFVRIDKECDYDTECGEE